MLSKIKEQFAEKRIAFGKSGKPLGQRDDLDELAIIALESGNKNLQNLFEHLPSLEQLKKAKAETQLHDVRKKLTEKPKSRKSKK